MTRTITIAPEAPATSTRLSPPPGVFTPPPAPRMPPSRGRLLVLRAAAAALAVALSLPVVVPAAMVYAYLHPPAKLPSRTPSDEGRTWQGVDISGPAGSTLAGWYLPGDRRRPLVLLAHGHAGNRKQMLGRAVALNAAGLPVLAFDFRGHGASTPAVCTLGAAEADDVLAAVDFAAGRLAHRQVVLFGLSMGASASILAAPRDRRIVGVIAEAPYDTLPDSVALHARLLLGPPGALVAPYATALVGLMAGIDPAAVSPAAAAARFNEKVPLLLLGSPDDVRMPPAVLHRVLAGASSRDKRVHLFPRGEHAKIREFDVAVYDAVVLDWLRTRFRDPDR